MAHDDRREDDEIPDLAALVDETADDKPTGAFAAASEAAGAEPTEEKATDAYNPSVAALVGRLEEPEIAAPASPELRRVREAIGVLQHDHAELELYKAIGNPRRGEAIDTAKKATVSAKAVLDELPVHIDEPDLAIERDRLQTEYAALRRLIVSLPPEPEPKPEAKPEPEPERNKPPDEQDSGPAAKTAAAVAARPSGTSKRIIALLALCVLAAGGRVVWGVVESSRNTRPPVVERGKDWVETHNFEAGLDRAELRRGVPTVESVRVRIDALQATVAADVVALDPQGDKLSLFYRWYRDGKLLHAATKRRLPAAEVRAGSRYHVEVRAGDGKSESRTFTTAALLVERKPRQKVRGGADGTAGAPGKTPPRPPVAPPAKGVSPPPAKTKPAPKTKSTKLLPPSGEPSRKRVGAPEPPVREPPRVGDHH